MFMLVYQAFLQESFQRSFTKYYINAVNVVLLILDQMLLIINSVRTV